MKSSSRAFVVFAMIGGLSNPAFAVGDKYEITPEEHAACDADAIGLCSAAADEDALIGCMKANRSRLSPACLVAFQDGLRKRHLPL